MAQAIGHLEMIRHFAAQFSPTGNIGEWDCRAVEDSVGWERDFREVSLIDSLIKSGWAYEDGSDVFLSEDLYRPRVRAGAGT